MLNDLKSVLSLTFPKADIHIEDFSMEHKGHLKGNPSETHLRIIIKDSSFENLSRLQQQRQVNEVLKPFFEKGLHAVELKLSHS